MIGKFYKKDIEVIKMTMNAKLSLYLEFSTGDKMK